MVFILQAKTLLMTLCLYVYGNKNTSTYSILAILYWD